MQFCHSLWCCPGVFLGLQVNMLFAGTPVKLYKLQKSEVGTK